MKHTYHTKFNDIKEIDDIFGFVRSLVKNKTVLDIGCLNDKNIGHNFISYTSTAKVAYGIDVNMDAVEKAQKVGIKNVQWGDILGNVFYILDDIKTVDTLLMIDVLEHLPDQLMAMRNCRLFADPAGSQLVIVTPNMMYEKNLDIMREHGQVLNLDPDHVLWHDRGTLYTILKKCGFTDIEIYFCGEGKGWSRKKLLAVCKIPPIRNIDICITAVRRPLLLKTLLKSFKKNMKLKDNRIIINIDPVGENIPSKEVLDVVYKYFSNVVYRMPEEKGNFTDALKWVWSQVETEYFLSLEDDWELIKPTDLNMMIQIMERNNNLAQLSLRWERQTKKYKWYKEYFDQGSFTGAPSLMRRTYIESMIPKIDGSKNVEKQLKEMREYFAYGQYTGGRLLSGNLRDHGDEWRPKAGWGKNGGGHDFITWVKVQEDKK